MTKNSESGHARVVASLDDLISFVQGYGESYNPTREALKLSALRAVSKSSKDVIGAVNAAIPSCSKAIAARERQLSRPLVNWSRGF